MGDQSANDRRGSTTRRRAAKDTPKVSSPEQASGTAGDGDAASAVIPPGQLYVNAAQLAHRYGVGLKWINVHKQHLGATPISDAANSKLRYHLPTADLYMEARRLEPTIKRRRSRRRKRGSEAQGRVRFV